MKVLVVGSLKEVPSYPELCQEFSEKLAATLVDRGHTIMTGCRGSLDKAIAEAAARRLAEKKLDARKLLVSYRLIDEEPGHRLGSIRVSSRTDWELSHPTLDPPEQFIEADVILFVAGKGGTYIGANWARIAGKPVLGIAQFGGAAAEIFRREREDFVERYAQLVSLDNFDLLNQDTLDMAALARDVVSLAEMIVAPTSVFTIMSFKEELFDVFASYDTVCKEYGFTAVRTDQVESISRIVPRILEGIKTSAFVIADVTEVSPNVFYELGYAQGTGKPVILTAKKGTDLPFDINDVPVIFWVNQENLKTQLRKRVMHIADQFGHSRVAGLQ